MSTPTGGGAISAAATDRLAEAFGDRLRAGAPASRASWSRVAGPAELWVDAASVDDLRRVVAALEGEGPVPVLVVGEGSNLLVAESGFPGLVVHLDRQGDFGRVDLDDGGVTAGGAVRLPDLARRCAEAGHAGLSWMAGIPGSVGGSVRMNAGVSADRVEVRHSLGWADVFDLGTGEVERLSPDRLGFAYRRSGVAGSQVVTSARFATTPGEPDAVAEENAVHLAHRRDTQETKRTGGSVWTNPAGTSAWSLVEAAGAKGLRVGTARVSDKHANFIVADPGGSADDVHELMAQVRRMVHQHSGVVLEAETVMVGFDPFEELS